MGFLRPVAMEKVGILGLKTDREAILSVLYDQRLVQVEPLRKEALAIFPSESTPELQRQVADQLLRIRGIKSALPATGQVVARAFPSRDGLLEAAQAIPIESSVTALKREEERLQTERKAVLDQLDLLGRFSFYTGRLEYLHLEHLLGFFGEARTDAYAPLRNQIAAIADVVFLESPGPETVRFVLAVNSSQVEAVSRLAQQRGVVLTSAPALQGTIADRLPEFQRRRDALDLRLAEIRRQLGDIAQEWYAPVASIEEALTIEARKLEVFGRIGAGETVFALEGWVPKRSRPALEAALNHATQNRTSFYLVPSTDEPPTLLDNPGWVRRYEFFIRFYAFPQSSEWDPTWIFAFAFPLFFGFMLSDIGYGFVILAFAVWMVSGFPGRRYVPGPLKSFLKRIMSPPAMQSLAWTLIPASIVAIAFGWFANGFFGPALWLHLPGPHFDVEKSLGDLFLVAGFIGLGMVVFGFVLGALKAYFHHHRKEMIARLSGIAIAFGLTFLGLQLVSKTFQRLLGPSIFAGGLSHPAAIVELGLLALGTGAILYAEGGQGFLALTEILSHILSYLRLVGILLSSFVVAFLVEHVAGNLLQSGVGGSVILGALLAVILLVGGQIFNLVVAVFEPGIQGARLIFVEHFSKFYTGNGKEFRPFGSRRTHTLPTAVVPDASGAAPSA